MRKRRKRRICVVITARPSYSRIKSALRAIQAHPELELQLVVAASALLDRYGMVARQMADDGFEIAARVYMVLEGENLAAMAKTTGLGLLELATVFDNLKPDAVVTIADRYETLATAIAAAYMNVPVVHVQGGEVTGSIDEKVRHAVTKLADLHLVATERARERVIRMGEDPTSVHVTGCPSIDLAAEVLRDPTLNFDPIAKYGGVGAPLDLARGYLVVMQHPVTTEYELARRHVWETLCAVRDSALPTLWFWPNADAGSDGASGAIRAFRENERPRNIRFFKNMAPDDFLRLIYNCRCLIGNSSVGIRECAYLGVPVINIGSRQDGRERGRNVLDVGYGRRAIIEALARHLGNGRYPSDPLYGDGRAGQRIAERLAQEPLRIEKRLTY
ncbi:UDP-N-acetylglucosamine 2-epimerase [Pyrinomonas methylaliphatogenes]|uniref:UDP-N-acetyl-D-glucosamine 2-epimerase, UDP-hydrolysing n=1 Tax=Pyrinomonas methylaliphatogenes TaxID=454194 RepID=A0A0B6WY14_9BACT|nr:UDP-N-acetylglucosamine 2-epimerase [Pyrinomonas methylaliphatogenes]CDM65179.1 UDP-N-acetyl-D-glucosamine 2-epimerase, UDP-hydrolysing [Pyrinomonas methylaliphatogenes]